VGPRRAGRGGRPLRRLRLSWDVVHYFLLTRAADLADQIDREVLRQGEDVAGWAGDPLVGWCVAVDQGEEAAFDEVLESRFNQLVRSDGTFDLLLAVSADGEYRVSNTRDGHDQPLPSETLERIRSRDYRVADWFRRARSGELVRIDHHAAPLLFPGAASQPADPARRHVGFAVPVRDPVREEEVVGVVLGLVGWDFYQAMILDARRRDYFQGLIGADIYSSTYAWLWGSDADTILAHPSVEILGTRVSQPPVELPQLARAAQAEDWAMYPEYEFRGALKNAAFKHCRPDSERGFGWVVGIGIDNDDIYATVNELRNLLINATSLLLGVVVLWTAFIARRTTRPILELERHTRRIASGDLDARVEVATDDELGQLAEAFNKMTADLRESRARIVKAEKEAAWREMARQVAHEIKNPLTPISLSANLLKRARDEGSEDFDRIFDRTIDLIQRQVANMRSIASEFHAFAGEHEPKLRAFDLNELVEEILDLNAAWAEELGVRVVVEGEACSAFADPNDVRRILINLVSNALEAMPEGGRLEVRVSPTEQRARVEVRDTGTGLTGEARERLFEPYFTTRTHGTGLGLAICKRLADGLGGEIDIEPVSEEGGGTRAVLSLPCAAEPS
jgi:signal transduction histidine kinase